jgi:hypothetical protein
VNRMKPSGVKWIGDIPESGSVVKLTWVARLESGHKCSETDCRLDRIEEEVVLQEARA